MVCDKDVCEMVCETKVDVYIGVTQPKRATQGHECHACHAKRRVDVRLCHACHVKPKWMSPSATPCHAKCRGVTRDQAGPRAPPRAMSATPATQNEGGCEIAPRLPRGTKVDVTKCHACHAKCRSVTRDQAGPSAPPSAVSATPAT